jgi:hypothetical protein
MLKATCKRKKEQRGHGNMDVLLTGNRKQMQNWEKSQGVSA